jgi:predicted ATPase
MPIKSVYIQNFKSIRDSGPIEIKPINVLIGANGVGKSNFIGFFKFLNMLFEKQLQNHIARKGRADGIMYFGRQSGFIAGKIIFTNEDDKVANRYRFKMEPDQSNSLFFTEEFSDYNMMSKISDEVSWSPKPINTGGSYETKLHDVANSTRTEFLKDFFESFKIFHFHDTSDSSKLKGFCNTTDYEYLVEDGSNLPAFLYRMKETAAANFKMLEYTVKSIAPFIDSLYLQPDSINSNQIELRWKEKGHDNLFNAYSLSDGTLRFICLCTLLLQPAPPSTIIIDEPELGLHPFAISKLAAMLRSAADVAQIIVSTQSVNLVNEFTPEDIIVVERNGNQTVFERQSEDSLKHWLEDYSLGQLWEKNILGGRPK